MKYSELELVGSKLGHILTNEGLMLPLEMHFYRRIVTKRKPLRCSRKLRESLRRAMTK